ncbi:uncharacterized protein CXorf38 homolog isoform X2 [Hyla sarda]|uniref:uncharacterized protein CXorf38 homolog isoform X2 n=1 Tax=Hyla sarda TaxID=327740 RepID=UPI0024C31D92|nr:uncharacterized protein CXorf38 homolog isoform X2 [Hyla sarda]
MIQYPFQPSCPVCAQWKELILAHHNYKNGDIHWGNSNPSLWPTHYWEVAKVYMPRGQAQVRGPEKCDVAALLNLMNTCDYFSGSNLSRVRELIKCRNELMHSADMKVSSSWLKHFEQKLYDLVSEFKHVPGLLSGGEEMQKVLLSELSIGVIEVDGIPKFELQSLITPVDLQGRVTSQSCTITRISPEEVEILLIQQLIQELCLEIEEQGSLTEENEDKVGKIKNFLSQNEDLGFVLQGDLKRLDNLRKNHVPPNAEGWIPPQGFAAFLVVLSLAFSLAYLFGQTH